MREDRKADFFPLSILGGSESKINLPEWHRAGQGAGLQESAGEPLWNPTPETLAEAGQEEDEGASFDVYLPRETRSLGQRGQDRFELGVPDAIKGLGVGADKLLSSFGVPSH